MKQLYTLILCLLSFFCFSQENETISSIISIINKSNYKIDYKAGNSKMINNYSLIQIKKIDGYKVFYAINTSNYKSLKNLITVCSGGTLLIFSEKHQKYVALNFFSGECLTKIQYNKYNLKLDYTLELLNFESFIANKNFNTLFYLNFYPTLNNDDPTNFIDVQKSKNRLKHQLNLDKRFFEVPIDELFEKILTKDNDEYLEKPIIHKSTFPFLKLQ